MKFALERYRIAQTNFYEAVLQEIRNGKKESNCMWCFFPYIRGLEQDARSGTNESLCIEEALEYWNDPALSEHMLELCRELMKLTKPLDLLLEPSDSMKLRASMTLFHLISDEQIFKYVLDKFYGGALDEYTVNALPEFYIDEHGIKVFIVCERRLELPLCKRNTGMNMELCRFDNKSGACLSITILGTPLKYSVPEDGKFYCVCCAGEYVKAFPSVKCNDKEIMIRTGKHVCILTDEYTKYWQETWLDWAHDRRGMEEEQLLSGHENPLVYANKATVVDSKDLLLYENCGDGYFVDTQLIAALDGGELCITSERQVLCRGFQTLDEGGAAIGIAIFDYGYAVHTRTGAVYYSGNGKLWQRIGESASAISANGRQLAWADMDANVFIYQPGRSEAERLTKLQFPGMYITDMDISNRFMAIKYLDGSFDVIDWHSGRSELGGIFISPDLC